MKIISHTKDVVRANITAMRLAGMGLPVVMTKVGVEIYVWMQR